MRRTRIVATIGPASDSDQVIKDLIAAGVDVFRLSFAHGDIPSGIERLRRIRALAPDLALMVDIPGPKIRAGSFGHSAVELKLGSEVELVEGIDGESTDRRICVERLGVLPMLKIGDKIHIGDGGVSLDVIATGKHLKSVVSSGGVVQGKPEIGRAHV